jgi:hypothetical protein
MRQISGRAKQFPCILLSLTGVLLFYYEVTGDERVPKFMLRYFQWQDAQSLASYKVGWGALRWADNLAEIYWLYNKTGQPWLLDLARKVPGWQADKDNVVGVLQPSPARSSELIESVSLIPMGAARLRITSFPTTSDGSEAHDWNKLEAALKVSGSFARGNHPRLAAGSSIEGGRLGWRAWMEGGEGANREG